MTQIRRAAHRLAGTSAKSKREIVTTAARGFVKDILKFTPPASKGSTGSAAKKAGEVTIDVDTALTMEVMSDRELSAQEQFHGGNSYAANQLKNKKGEVYLTDTNHIIRNVAAALAFHLSKRSRATGRPMSAVKGRTKTSRVRSREAGAHNNHVGRSRADDLALVSKQTLEGVRKLLKKRVGILAAGWTAAALRLNVSVPAWIKRHPATHGHIAEVAAGGRFTLILDNAVPFVGNIRAYEDRVQRVVNYQAGKMHRQADYLMAKAIRQAGW